MLWVGGAASACGRSRERRPADHHQQGRGWPGRGLGQGGRGRVSSSGTSGQAGQAGGSAAGGASGASAAGAGGAAAGAGGAAAGSGGSAAGAARPAAARPAAALPRAAGGRRRGRAARPRAAGRPRRGPGGRGEPGLPGVSVLCAGGLVRAGGVAEEAAAKGRSVPVLPENDGDLLFCEGGKWAVKEACAYGCKQEPKGTPDTCKPKPQPECPCFVESAWCGTGAAKEAETMGCTIPLLPTHASEYFALPGRQMGREAGLRLRLQRGPEGHPGHLQIRPNAACSLLDPPHKAQLKWGLHPDASARAGGHRGDRGGHLADHRQRGGLRRAPTPRTARRGALPTRRRPTCGSSARPRPRSASTSTTWPRRASWPGTASRAS